ncbi:hypothetical protein NIES3974_03000 [Calothrix sp. NIES-3974]|nr:hypothetical protein NIES3974_03000 [Calothrix sp. NIES-3974]
MNAFTMNPAKLMWWSTTIDLSHMRDLSLKSRIIATPATHQN